MYKLIKPYISFETVASEMKEIFDSGILTKGFYSKEFPKKIAEYTGAKYAFLTTSATTALWACLKYYDVKPGDEVVVSDFSFPATVNVVEDLGARPIFADVSRETFNMLPEELEKKITDKTKAVMFVDAAGNPSGVRQIKAICEKAGIPLIEDAACAIGSKVGEKRVGNISDLSCFSMHPRKLLTCGEGGAITTNDDAAAEFFSYKLMHGADASGQFISYGYNFRLPEVSCLMGIKQLEYLDEIVAERRAQADEYASILEPLGFVRQAVESDVYHNIQSMLFTVPEGCDRDELIAYLREREVESTIGTYCQSECVYYRQKYNEVQPNGSFLQHNTICLPCYSGLPVAEVASIVAGFFQ